MRSVSPFFSRARPTSRAKRVGIIAVAVATLTAFGIAPANAVVVPPSGLGFTDGAPFLNYSDGDLNREFQVGHTLGTSWVRVVVNWSAIESRPGVFDFGNTDRVINLAKANGYKVLAVLAGTPLWAQGPIPNPFLAGIPPSDPKFFGTFAGVAAQHLGDRVDTYEVWNEPNIPTFFTPVDASRYTQMLRWAYPAIHNADPGSTVLSAGLSPTINFAGGFTVAPVTFLQQMYASGAGGFMDGVAMHPYTFPYTVENDAGNQWGQVAQAHDVMAANGDGGKKIWITEIGAPTGTNQMAVSVPLQKEIIDSSLRKASTLPYVGTVFIHSLRDNGTDPADSEQNFGLLRNDFTAK